MPRSLTKPAAIKHRATGTKALALPAECVLDELAALKTKLKRALAARVPAPLDAGAVIRIDTPALQLLAAFVREREARGQPIVWRQIAPRFAAAAKRLGLETALRLVRE